MTSYYDATTTAQRKALLEGLAQAGYKVSNAGRLDTPKRVGIEHTAEQAADVEAAVRTIDPNATKV